MWPGGVAAAVSVLALWLTAPAIAQGEGSSERLRCSGASNRLSDVDSALALLVLGRLEGRVVDRETGEGVAGVEMSVTGWDAATRTDEEGRFELDRVPPGNLRLDIGHLSYGRQHTCVEVPPGRFVQALIVLDPEPVELEPLEVLIEEVRPRWLERVGFYRRMRASDGVFITREEILEEDPSRLTELFRGTIGVEVRNDDLVPRHGPTTMLTVPNECRVQYFVSGRRMPLPLGLNTFQPGDVEAIEAYFGASRLPPQFNLGRAACGAVVIWLRQRP